MLQPVWHSVAYLMSPLTSINESSHLSKSLNSCHSFYCSDYKHLRHHKITRMFILEADWQFFFFFTVATILSNEQPTHNILFKQTSDATCNKLLMQLLCPSRKIQLLDIVNPNEIPYLFVCCWLHQLSMSRNKQSLTYMQICVSIVH